MHVDPNKFNYTNLVQITWKAEISEYEYNLTNYHNRIEFNQVNFMGRGTSSYPYCSVGAMIQNIGHTFVNDEISSRSASPPSMVEFRGLGFYFSSLNSTWSDSSHGVKLNADPNVYPNFARTFENVDNLGYSAKNIYTKQNVGYPSQSTPISVRWTVTKKGIVINPPDNLSKNLQDKWVQLKGTFVIWNFKIEINDVSYDVADYYLPIENAEFIWAWDPLMLHQEYFGSSEKNLDAQKGTVKYVEIRASDGSRWYNLEDWNITWRIDDFSGNLDNRFGWSSDGHSLNSQVGHTSDVTSCFRDPGKSFNIKWPVTDVEAESSLPNIFSLDQNYPNPFNPSTTINYSIQRQSWIVMKIYDVLGREISTLVNEEKPKGKYKVTLSSGSLPSGIYFYQMKTKDFIQTKKMVLLKHCGN